jgi:hypothetical protein
MKILTYATFSFIFLISNQVPLQAMYRNQFPSSPGFIPTRNIPQRPTVIYPKNSVPTYIPKPSAPVPSASNMPKPPVLKPVQNNVMPKAAALAKVLPKNNSSDTNNDAKNATKETTANTQDSAAKQNKENLLEALKKKWIIECPRCRKPYLDFETESEAKKAHLAVAGTKDEICVKKDCNGKIQVSNDYPQPGK